MYPDTTHQHKYIVLDEYQTSGPNLVGKNVACTMEKVVCTECKEDNIRLKHE